MELDRLKSNWKNAGTGKRSQQDLLFMTKIKNHPQVKQIRLKFLIEGLLLVVFLNLYYDGFDGAAKPLWVNILLISSIMAYILIRFAGWVVLRNPVKADNLKGSLKIFSRNLQRIAFFTLMTSFLFGLSIILFFSATINFTKGKYAILAGMIITLFVLVFLSSKKWINRVKSIERTIEELRESPQIRKGNTETEN